MDRKTYKRLMIAGLVPWRPDMLRKPRPRIKPEPPPEIKKPNLQIWKFEDWILDL